RLAVARVLRRFPGVTDACEARLEIASRWVEQSLERLFGGTGNLQVGRNVVQEEILEDVGTVIAPSRLPIVLHLLDELRVVARPTILREEVLMGVHKSE